MQSKEMWADVQHRKLLKFIGTIQTVSTGQDPDTQTLQSELMQLKSDASQRDSLKNCVTLVSDNYVTTICINSLCSDRQVQLWNQAA